MLLCSVVGICGNSFECLLGFVLQEHQHKGPFIHWFSHAHVGLVLPDSLCIPTGMFDLRFVRPLFVNVELQE